MAKMKKSMNLPKWLKIVIMVLLIYLGLVVLVVFLELLLSVGGLGTHHLYDAAELFIWIILAYGFYKGVDYLWSRLGKRK